MVLSDISVRRPVFAIMMTSALVVLGAASYRGLGLDLMPKTDSPLVTVSASLPGASAEEVETQLTKRIEEAVNTINGIDELRSTSQQGSSRVSVIFTLERDIDSAVQDVRDKLSTIVSQFPRDTLPLQINKVDPDGEMIYGFGINGARDLKELTEIVDKDFKQVIETLPGVGSATLNGTHKREIQLLLDANRMTAYGLTVDQVRAAVQRQNTEIPGGSFVNGSSEVALRTMGRIKSVADFNRIILAYRDGSAVTFSDIGRVVDGFEEIRNSARSDGRPNVGMAIRKQSGANTVEVVDHLTEKLDELRAKLPPDLQFKVGNDQSRYIRKSFEDIQKHLVIGGLLASLVVFFFLRNVRATIISALAVPVSIIGTFTFMKLLGFTLNNMTMLALSLATGIVIDDAIVVLENIHRFVDEHGLTPHDAAIRATREIGMAVTATTLSLVVIFAPVAFMTGEIGRYFYSFGITSAVAIMLSMFVSFTLTPALCSMWMKPHDPSHPKRESGRLYRKVDATYARTLTWALDHRRIMLAVAVLVAASVAVLYPYIGREVVPDDDQGEFSVNIRLPRGTSYQRTEDFTLPIEKELLALPSVTRVRTNVNVGNANFNITLTPLEERNITQQALIIRTRALLRKYQGGQISVSGGTDISGASTSRGRGGGGGGNRLSVLIQGPDIEQLQEYTVQLMDKVRTIRGVVDVDSNFEPTQPELRVNVDRARAADQGVNIDTLASNLRTLVGGEEVSEFKDGDDQFMVRLRLDEPFRRNPVGLGNLLVPAGPGKTVRVSDVATLTEERGPGTIDRYNRQRQISVNANIDRVPLSDVLTAAHVKVDELSLKPGYKVVFGGSAKTLAEASTNFTVAIILAVVFIYMVLASQFNSFVHPLTIMTSLPLSLPAGLLTLLAFGMTLNVYSAIGLMMLFGVVKKNSILQVDYTNTLRSQGMGTREALITSSRVRLRPILMTTVAIIAGMIPIALGRGAGAGSRSSMAVTIIGGQTLCLALTLLITPVMYSCFEDLSVWSRSGGFLRVLPETWRRLPAAAVAKHR